MPSRTNTEVSRPGPEAPTVTTRLVANLPVTATMSVMSFGSGVIVVTTVTGFEMIASVFFACSCASWSRQPT